MKEIPKPTLKEIEGKKQVLPKREQYKSTLVDEHRQENSDIGP
jgi:hypothetical protein